MIRYVETIPLRVERSDAPQFPFWHATLIAPYGSRRAAPVSIDYTALLAVAGGRGEVSVTRDVVDQMERQKKLPEPILIDATEEAEALYERGKLASDFASNWRLQTLLLISADGKIPLSCAASTMTAICTWPVEKEMLKSHSRQLRERRCRWGMVVPIVFPMTTDLGVLDDLAEIASGNGAEFLAALPIDLDPQAKSALAELRADDETYETLFHSDLETITIATERHVAALAAERGLFDYVRLPNAAAKSNWNASVLLTLAGTRLLRMNRDAEAGWDLLRSARIVAQLKKPLERIAEAASLTIIEGLDAIAVRALEEWIGSGKSADLDAIDTQWRLRRTLAQ